MNLLVGDRRVRASREMGILIARWDEHKDYNEKRGMK